MKITWRTLDRWPAGRTPTPATHRETGGAFRAGCAQTLDELEKELEMIGARDVVAEIDVEPRGLRKSGEPRADNRTRTTPGIVLHFTNRQGRAVTMPCDKYRYWQSNLRALMLTLRALRAVDRYGATATGEQYAGWTALPASTTTALSTDAAAEVLARRTGRPSPAIVRDREVARTAYREAASAAHPDRGGRTEDFQLVQEAKRVLEAHFGATL